MSGPLLLVAAITTGVPVSEVLLADPGTGFDDQRIEAAGLGQRMKVVVSGGRKKRLVGVDQPVEPIHQHADREAIEQLRILRGIGARQNRLRLEERGGIFKRRLFRHRFARLPSVVHGEQFGHRGVGQRFALSAIIETRR